MICYRDMVFCSDADKCGNADTCQCYFSELERDRAERWWGNDGALVAFQSFKDDCESFKEKA